MKRMTAILLTAVIVMTALAALPAAADDGTIFSGEGITVRTLRYELNQAKYTGTADIRLFVRISNDSDRPVSIWMEKATMDGVSVVVAPVSGIEPHSTSDPEELPFFYIFCPSANKEAAAKAILTSYELKGTMVLKTTGRDGKEEEFYRKKVTISLKGMDGARNTVRPEATAKPKPTATPRPTLKPNSPEYHPASTNYKTLKEKDRGRAVKDLQQRLTDLGYLTDKVNGTFGVTTTFAFRDFCYQNGLTISNSVSPEAQRYLYSTRAKHYEHQWIPLMIGAHCKWDNAMDAANLGFLYVQLVNRQNRAIRGYELDYYYTNVWGENLGVRGGQWVPMKERVPLGITHTKRIGGGEYFYDQGIPIAGFASVYSVWVGVRRIVFTDGEIREIPEDQVVYYECVVKD